MKANYIYQLLIGAFTLVILLACNALVPLPDAMPSPLPPTAMSAPPSQAFVISAQTVSETGENPDYTIEAQYPAIMDSNEPQALAFNDEMHTLVQGQIDAFKQNILELPADPNFAPSSFDGKFGLLFQRDDLVSIKFDVSGYTSGAAHPYHYTITINYDFNQQRSLALDELFLPGSNYLEAISSYCIAELSTRDIGFDMFSEGAAPTPENYRNWNITPDGLMVTFDEYQVAAYAAGPQTVIVPFSELQAIIDPQGPLKSVNQ